MDVFPFAAVNLTPNAPSASCAGVNFPEANDCDIVVSLVPGSLLDAFEVSPPAIAVPVVASTTAREMLVPLNVALPFTFASTVNPVMTPVGGMGSALMPKFPQRAQALSFLPGAALAKSRSSRVVLPVFDQLDVHPAVAAVPLVTDDGPPAVVGFAGATLA